MISIGILTHHFASNFGANLQVLSTYEYFKRNGFNPYVINWRTKSLEQEFSKTVPKEQTQMHLDFINRYLNLTNICYTAKDIAGEIDRLGLKAVVIGSDAVVQHWPAISRINFPTRKIVSYYHYSADRMFPNIFWSTFYPYLQNPVKMIYMSVSSQNSPYKYFSRNIKKEMAVCLSRFSYISVRDSWTQKMFKQIDRFKPLVPVTPDPVFSFNTNAGYLIPSFEAIKEKYGLPEKYFLLCFFRGDQIRSSWINEFVESSNKMGYECFSFPLPAKAFEHERLKTIKYPLPPLDWYAIIKYSSGFVGRNMHPIVICLHNSIPCYSFDQYGTKVLNTFVNVSSSKIYHILEKAGLRKNRTTFAGPICNFPSVNKVLNCLTNYDKTQYLEFSVRQQAEYDEMMNNICNIIKE
jgi:hypothetical protein